MTTAEAIVLFALAIIPLGLTATMFASKQSMLGFPCAMFWMIFGSHCYILAAGADWASIYYYLFFASAFGMTAFTALAAFGLREKRDTIADVEMEGKDPGYIDEDKPQQPSRRTRELRSRAEKRRR